jgi:hypothetical protein
MITPIVGDYIRFRYRHYDPEVDRFGRFMGPSHNNYVFIRHSLLTIRHGYESIIILEILDEMQFLMLTS